MVAVLPWVSQHLDSGPRQTPLSFHRQRLGLRGAFSGHLPSLVVPPLPGAPGISLGWVGAPEGGRRGSPRRPGDHSPGLASLEAGRRESSVGFCSGSSWRRLFPGLGRKPQKSTCPGPAPDGSQWRAMDGDLSTGAAWELSRQALDVQHTQPWGSAGVLPEHTQHRNVRTPHPPRPPLRLREKPRQHGTVSSGLCWAPPHRSTETH